MALPASQAHRPTITKEGIKATRDPLNILSMVSMDKYQVPRQDSLLHISTGIRKDRVANTARHSMAEDMGSNNNHQHTADSKEDILRTSLQRRASIPLSRHTAKVFRMGVTLVMEAMRSIRVISNMHMHRRVETPPSSAEQPHSRPGLYLHPLLPRTRLDQRIPDNIPFLSFCPQ